MHLWERDLFGILIRRRRLLLLGEDSPPLREFLDWILRDEGYEVVAAPAADDLLDALAASLHPELGEDRFDLVVADLGMLGPARLSLLDKFGELPEVPPLVLIAGAADPELSAAASESWAAALLDPPIDIAVLRCLVRRLVSGRAALPS